MTCCKSQAENAQLESISLKLSDRIALVHSVRAIKKNGKSNMGATTSKFFDELMENVIEMDDILRKKHRDSDSNADASVLTFQQKQAHYEKVRRSNCLASLSMTFATACFPATASCSNPITCLACTTCSVSAPFATNSMTKATFSTTATALPPHPLSSYAR